MPSTAPQTFSLPTRVVHEPEADRFSVVVETRGATLEDITVAVGSQTIRLEVDGLMQHVDEFVPPSPERSFGDDRQAHYHNGILTISVETVPRRD
ncbi:Hsp20/alpha crystallin family protein [Halobacteria archaeon AArc-curdl1]|uniref:Hsp20/alpha crystallin family protein n=1 Tax=Natronosalvus hydrolyticus TaxID=2979988 RepID=A0AAP2Z841_9EURY|nr:Hsp20/alpha crystallin family protein [Halobacteria archaeon AArc-curdl1]